MYIVHIFCVFNRAPCFRSFLPGCWSWAWCFDSDRSDGRASTIYVYIRRLGKHKLCIRMLVMFGERVGGVWCVYFCRSKFIVVGVRNGFGWHVRAYKHVKRTKAIPNHDDDDDATSNSVGTTAAAVIFACSSSNSRTPLEIDMNERYNFVLSHLLFIVCRVSCVFISLYVRLHACKMCI